GPMPGMGPMPGAFPGPWGPCVPVGPIVAQAAWLAGVNRALELELLQIHFLSILGAMCPNEFVRNLVLRLIAEELFEAMFWNYVLIACAVPVPVPIPVPAPAPVPIPGPTGGTPPGYVGPGPSPGPGVFPPPGFIGVTGVAGPPDPLKKK
ncbi:MAG: hypothetical protein ACYC38_13745, partial [Eubacteriales bacterium]